MSAILYFEAVKITDVRLSTYKSIKALRRAYGGALPDVYWWCKGCRIAWDDVRASPFPKPCPCGSEVVQVGDLEPCRECRGAGRHKMSCSRARR